MLLAEKEQQRVRACSEYVYKGARIGSFLGANCV